MDYLLEIKNISGGYHKKTVIKGLSLKITKGEFIGIIGPNGSGKTTLLRILSRILFPQEGSINLEGKNISSMPLREFAKRAAFVPQDTLLNFPFSVIEIVLMGRIPHLRRLEFESKKDFLVAEQALSMTDALHLKNRMVNELSSGEKQRIIIARALTQEPILLFLDEPTSHLDIAHQIQILDLLRKLNQQQNLTIVMVLHDLNLASEYTSRIILLNEGRIFKEGLPKDVLTYQNIEKVYKTVVVVKENPVNAKPYVFLVSGLK